MEENTSKDVTAWAAVAGMILQLLRFLTPDRKPNPCTEPKPDPCGCSEPKPEKRPCIGFGCPKEEKVV